MEVIGDLFQRFFGSKSKNKISTKNFKFYSNIQKSKKVFVSCDQEDDSHSCVHQKIKIKLNEVTLEVVNNISEPGV